jgi:two-component system sensor histidine kinase GlrK
LLPSQREIVAITLSNTRLLRQRVDALLRHDAANWLAQPLDMRVHELNALIEDAAVSMRPCFQQKRITLELPQDSLLVPVDGKIPNHY